MARIDAASGGLMNERHVFRDIMTRYPADERQERRQLLLLMSALAALVLVMAASLFA